MTALLPDALADALGRVVSDCRKEWLKEIDRIGAEARAVIAELKAENAGMRRHYHEVVATYSARIDAALAQVKDGAPGKDGRDGVDGKEGAAGRDGIDGKSVAVEDVAPIVVGEVGRALTALPPPKDGRDGVDGKDGAPGRDGADGYMIDPEALKAMVTGQVVKAVAALPPAKDGRDGEPGEKGADGRDGKDAEPIAMSEILMSIDGAVELFMRANPPPEGKSGQDGKNGDPGERGLEGAAGRDGRDGLPGVPGTNGEKGRDGIDGKDGAAGLNGKDGADGLGFDDMTVEHDNERSFKLRFTRGTESKEFPIVVPMMIYRGVFTEGHEYARGDVTTWAGSLWHANQATADKPGDGSKSWTLAAKRGAEGKPGAPGKSALSPVVRADR